MKSSIWMVMLMVGAANAEMSPSWITGAAVENLQAIKAAPMNVAGVEFGPLALQAQGDRMTAYRRIAKMFEEAKGSLPAHDKLLRWYSGRVFWPGSPNRARGALLTGKMVKPTTIGDGGPVFNDPVLRIAYDYTLDDPDIFDEMSERQQDASRIEDNDYARYPERTEDGVVYFVGKVRYELRASGDYIVLEKSFPNDNDRIFYAYFFKDVTPEPEKPKKAEKEK